MADKIDEAIRQLVAAVRALFPGFRTAVAAPAGSASPSGLLGPTPLADEVPGQIGKTNTIQNRNIAPRSVYRDAVNAAIDRVREKAMGIDPQDRDSIVNHDLYIAGVIDDLRRQGFNAAYDGEELAINRPGDSFSEHFDISTWQGRVRRFYASWVSPPAFAAE